MRIYVGNLPFSVSENELREMFEEFGSVTSASVVSDRETGRSRGFGFVEMADADAQGAIEAMNGRDHGGRALVVNEAKPREQGSRGGFGGGGGRGGFGGGRGGGGDRGGRW